MVVDILWFVVGLVNGFKDRSALNRFPRGYWNKSEGWVYKWKFDDKGKRIPQEKKLWYYLWRWTPTYKERFPYFSTALVFLTDGWHLLQFIQFKAAMASVLLVGDITQPWWLVGLRMIAAFSIGFWFSYEGPEKKRDKG